MRERVKAQPGINRKKPASQYWREPTTALLSLFHMPACAIKICEDRHASGGHQRIGDVAARGKTECAGWIDGHLSPGPTTVHGSDDRRSRNGENWIYCAGNRTHGRYSR